MCLLAASFLHIAIRPRWVMKGQQPRGLATWASPKGWWRTFASRRKGALAARHKLAMAGVATHVPPSRVADDETWRGGAHRSGRGHQSCSSGRWWRISHARQIVSTVRCRPGWSGRRSCICPLFRRGFHEHYERLASRTPPNAVDLPQANRRVPLFISSAAAP